MIQETVAAILPGGHMGHDLDLHHSWRQAPPNEAGILCRTDDERECPFDETDASATTKLEGESHRVMDELLRECLRRKHPDLRSMKQGPL